MTLDGNRTHSDYLTERPESCCCASGEANCLNCMQGNHGPCFNLRWNRYRSPEDRLTDLERRVEALEGRRE